MVRELGWHQHRLFKGPDRQINLHVFSVGSHVDAKSDVIETTLTPDGTGVPITDVSETRQGPI